MWLFGKLTEGRPSPKPVERSISIRRSGDTVNDVEEHGQARGYGDGRGMFGNTSYGRRNYSSTQDVEDARRIEYERDDDDSVDTTSSSVSGSVGGEGVNGRGHSGHSKEPLDPRIWSNVNSPGFVTRIVQQANGGTRNEFKSTGGRSPFSRSPNGHLKIGQLPIPTVPRRPASSLLSFPSPKGRSLYSYGRYTKLQRQDSNHTVFVKVAPVDLNGSAPPVVPLTPSPSNSPSKVSPVSLSYNESAVQGLGGVPQVALSRKFSKLWPNSVKRNEGGIMGNPRTGYQLSTSPVNESVIEALASRKRSRDAAKYNDTQTYRQPMPVALTSDDVTNKHSKRVKFISEQDLNRPLAFDQYTDLGASGTEPLTSKSILEQMNQTEKRFLPDSIPSPVPKRTKIMASSQSPVASSSSAMGQQYRKRRSDNGIGVIELDEDCLTDPKSKTGKFCHCNECYMESAGGVNNTPSKHSPSKSHNSSSLMSPPMSLKKKVTFQDTSKSQDTSFTKSFIDKGVSTDSSLDPGPSRFIRKVTETNTVMTKENYIYDQARRMERFRRALGITESDKSLLTNDTPKGELTTSKVENNTQASSMFGLASSTKATTTTVPNFLSSTSNSEGTKPFTFNSTAPTISTASTASSSASITVVSASEDKVDGPPIPSFTFGSGPAASTSAEKLVDNIGIKTDPKSVKIENEVSKTEHKPVKVENSSEEALGLGSAGFNFTPQTTASTTPTPAFSQTTTSTGFEAPKPFSFGSSTASAATVPPVSMAAPVSKVETAPSIGSFFQTSSATQGSGGVTQQASTFTAPAPAFSQPTSAGSEAPKPFSFGSSTAPAAAAPVVSVAAPVSKVDTAPSSTGGFFQFGQPSSTQRSGGLTPQTATFAAPAPAFSQPTSTGSEAPKPFSFGSSTAIATPAPLVSMAAPVSKVETAPSSTGGFFSFGQNSSASQSSGGITPQQTATFTPAPAFSQPTSAGSEAPKPFSFGSTNATAPSAQLGNATSQNNKVETTTSTGGMFQFSQPSSTTQSAGGVTGGFSFTPQTSSFPAPAPAFPQPTNTGPEASKGFSFGSSNASVAAGPFSGMASPINKVEQAPSAAGMFQFGQNSSTTQSSGGVSGGFSFTPQSNFPAPAPAFSQPTNTAPEASKGFSFGSSTNASTPFGSMASQANKVETAPNTGGLFQFGQTSSTTQGSGGGFNFGQQVTSPFNAPASPAAGGAMFSLGSKTSTPRSSGRSRRYR